MATKKSMHEPIELFYRTNKEIDQQVNLFKECSVLDNFQQESFRGQWLPTALLRTQDSKYVC